MKNSNVYLLDVLL